MAQLVHHSKRQYPLNRTMRVEIQSFREALADGSDVVWEHPIALSIPRTPTATAFGDSCLEAGGGFSVPLAIWWHLTWPPEVVARTLIHKAKNDDGLLISINVLEFVTVVINYCAAYTAICLLYTSPSPRDRG